jgi:hypothetical protein
MQFAGNFYRMGSHGRVVPIRKNLDLPSMLSCYPVWFRCRLPGFIFTDPPEIPCCYGSLPGCPWYSHGPATRIPLIPVCSRTRIPLLLACTGYSYTPDTVCLGVRPGYPYAPVTRMPLPIPAIGSLMSSPGTVPIGKCGNRPSRKPCTGAITAMSP